MWACFYGSDNKHFTTAGVSQCVWSCVWCWWSGPLPQSFPPCIALSLSLEQCAWKEGRTFGICAVLCKIRNTGHLCYTRTSLIQYKYLFILKQMPFQNRPHIYVSEEQGRGLAAMIIDRSTEICSEIVHKFLTDWFGFLHFTICL